MRAYAWFQDKLETFLADGVQGYKIDRGEESEVPEYLENCNAVLFPKMAAEGLQRRYGEDYFVFARNLYDEAVFVAGEYFLGPEFQGRMEVVEHQHPTRPQEACRICRGIIRPFAATPSIQDQEVERPVPLDQVPVTMKHRHVRKVGKERLQAAARAASISTLTSTRTRSIQAGRRFASRLRSPACPCSSGKAGSSREATS